MILKDRICPSKYLHPTSISLVSLVVTLKITLFVVISMNIVFQYDDRSPTKAVSDWIHIDTIYYAPLSWYP